MIKFQRDEPSGLVRSRTEIAITIIYTKTRFGSYFSEPLIFLHKLY